MKLYFYILERPRGKKPFVRCDECEVIEKPKTYYPVNRFPRGVYGLCVNKKKTSDVYLDMTIIV